MKRRVKSWLSATLAFALAGSAALAGSGSVNITNTPVLILPMPGSGRGMVEHVTGTVYSAGQYIRSGGRAYYCVTGGTSSNSASWKVLPGGDTDITDGTVVWRPCLATPRLGLVISNGSTNSAYLYVNGTGKSGAGARLATGERLQLDNNCPQSAIWAQSSMTNINEVLYLEW